MLPLLLLREVKELLKHRPPTPSEKKRHPKQRLLPNHNQQLGNVFTLLYVQQPHRRRRRRRRQPAILFDALVLTLVLVGR
jgi:hypothetical protein